MTISHLSQPQLLVALNELSSHLDGQVLSNEPGKQPIDPHCWNALLKGPSGKSFIPPVPLAYVQCANRTDALMTVQFAIEHGIRIQGKGCGHHYGGACLADGGIVIDMSRMKQITVDPKTRTAIVQPGVTTEEVRKATIPHGLHFPGGHISSVGISGFILGGGNGWGVKHCGSAADNVVEFEVVVPATAGKEEECKLQRVNQSTDPELFWGLKGAGMFMGIVTEFVIQLHATPQRLPCITAVYPLSMAQKVGSFFQKVYMEAPLEIEPSLVYTGREGAPKPGANGMEYNDPAVVLSLVSFLPPEDPRVQACFDAVRHFEPHARSLPLLDSVPTYDEALSSLDVFWSWSGLSLYSYGSFVPQERLDGDFMQVLHKQAEASTSPYSMILIAAGNPRVQKPCRHPSEGQVDGQETSQSAEGVGKCLYSKESEESLAAYNYRGCVYVCPYALWSRTAGGAEVDGDEHHIAWVRNTSSAMKPWVTGCYLNEIMLDQPGQVELCYDHDDLVRIRQLKARVDPQGLLRPVH
ncbi:hypothetical protein CEUSTIGMA_g4478.t1 [Chlamydomonas eustigma]|uniref:FAD-binding PCMH-type domain-containing protein n=1 Tax=Chlamydomonas eustigma TaxID=1157962 RepID=A0A250X1S8_9CHLO|nr:hypothetical protein CEUSTIGMA_g4478.t1 [Chlamydomonas eustigma]|eukprot:GAX77031.1 hypothetical protein CEUSTIGMA_g4478.t1 [Chlamydomonas eustigma]